MQSVARAERLSRRGDFALAVRLEQAVSAAEAMTGFPADSPDVLLCSPQMSTICIVVTREMAVETFEKMKQVAHVSLLSRSLMCAEARMFSMAVAGP